MTKAMKAILAALSYQNIELDSARKLAALKKLDPIRIFVKKADTTIYNGNHPIPVRLYYPSEEMMHKTGEIQSVLLFFHGGGWTTESVETYDRICSRMAQSTGRAVVSVEYRLAPEHPFPAGLTDCYTVAKAMYGGKLLPGVSPDGITIVGDSAGGNLAAAVCLAARDHKDFSPKKLILIYPAVNNCYSEDSVYASVRENGDQYLLTRGKMEDYLNMYVRDKNDLNNPYVAPILAKDFSRFPDTLILTAELDPLRDEGEDFGRRLQMAGNSVHVHRISGAFHGYFVLGIQHLHVQESFQYINAFLEDEKDA